MKFVCTQLTLAGVTLELGAISHREETRNLQLEIDHLHRKLRRKQRKKSPSSSWFESSDDDNYRPESRTHPSESFSYRGGMIS